MAQIVRAILFAKGIATSIRGCLASICASQDPLGIDWRPSQFSRDIPDDEQLANIGLSFLRNPSEPLLAP